MQLSRFLLVFSLAILSLGLGCSDGNGSKLKLVHVSGTVKLGDKPLSQGTITFMGDGQGGTTAAGDINKSGYYTVSTQAKGDGIPPGSYKVRIESWESPPKMDEKGVDPGKSAIPARYNGVETSGLKAEVKDSPSSQTVDFTLMP